jgi:hypothetical protein
MQDPVITLTKNGLGDPIPVRLRGDDERRLDELKGKTNLSRSDLLRRAAQYALPLFLSGEVSVVSVK